MDRLLDLYVMAPMQAIVADKLHAEGDRDAIAVDKARATLVMAYDLLEQRLTEREWIAGPHFSMANCTAALALFYAFTLVPLPADHHRLAAYFEHLLLQASVARTLDEARPYFYFYPYREAIPSRFRLTAAA